MASITRAEKIRNLRAYFLKELVEDPIDGTTFDCDVLDALSELEKKYSDKREHYGYTVYP